MLNKNIIILLFCLAISFLAKGQVTGNIKLVDIYGNLLTDHSGTMVVFEPQSGGAVQDTVYTDVNGDYSATLSTGQYKAVFSHAGYGTKDFPRGTSPAAYISAPNYLVPFDRLTELLPETTLTGNVSGNLLPFTHYIIEDSITILQGDTLRIPEGTWLNTNGGPIKVYGSLELTGTSQYPSVILAADSGFGGYTTFDLDVDHIFVQPNGHVKIAHTIIGKGKIYIDNGSLDIEQSNNKYQPTSTPAIDSLSWFPNTSSYLSLYLLTSDGEVNITESNIYFFVTAEVNSRLNLSCNYLDGEFTLKSRSSLFAYDNYWGNGNPNPITILSGDTIVAENNYFNGYQFSFNNAITQDTIVAILNNNTFYGAHNIINEGLVEFYLINNLGLSFEIPSIANFWGDIKEAKFNLIGPGCSNSLPVCGFIPTLFNYPSGMLTDYGTNTIFDSIDIYQNRYIVNHPIFDQSTGFLLAGADSFYLNTGDPSILDPDGSRSDKGARQPSCLNPLLLFQPNNSGPSVLDSVYPGDANYDGVCDNADLLPIGYMYGQTGPLRVGASLAWVGQYADPWSTALPNGQNAKHSDCDGSGLVDYGDVAAIYQNFGLTHQILKQPFGDGLWLQFPSDSIFEGDTIEVGIMLGTNQSPVTGISGLAFSINYDPAFIKPGSARMTFDNCWLGTDSVDLVTFNREDTTVHRVDVALSRTDRVQLSGSGSIGTLIVVINDDIQAKDSMTLTTFMDFSNILAKNASYSDITVGGNYGDFNVQVGYERLPSAIGNQPSVENISIYPNPAKGLLYINTETSGKSIACIYDLNGAMKLQTTFTGNNYAIDVSTIEKGFYLLRVENNETVSFLKLIIE